MIALWVATSAGPLVLRLVRLEIDLRMGVDLVAPGPGTLNLEELEGVVVGAVAVATV